AVFLGSGLSGRLVKCAGQAGLFWLGRLQHLAGAAKHLAQCRGLGLGGAPCALALFVASLLIGILCVAGRFGRFFLGGGLGGFISLASLLRGGVCFNRFGGLGHGLGFGRRVGRLGLGRLGSGGLGLVVLALRFGFGGRGFDRLLGRLGRLGFRSLACGFGRLRSCNGWSLAGVGGAAGLLGRGSGRLDGLVSGDGSRYLLLDLGLVRLGGFGLGRFRQKIGRIALDEHTLF